MSVRKTVIDMAVRMVMRMIDVIFDEHLGNDEERKMAFDEVASRARFRTKAQKMLDERRKK